MIILHITAARLLAKYTTYALNMAMAITRCRTTDENRKLLYNPHIII